MSKIEDALRKARASGALTTASHAQRTNLQLVPTGKVDTELAHELEVSQSRAIARMREPRPLTKEELAENRLISRDMADGRVANAFREARTKLLQRSGGKNRIIMVTPVSQGSGGSFVAMNLAVSFSFDESKTGLLVDCNIDDSAYRKLIRQESHLGLMDYLEREDVSMEQIIHPVGIPRLRIIPAGKRREVPAEYFTSIKMRELMYNVRQRYHDRFIIVDAPPVFENADTQILCELCDDILLVVPYGKVTVSKINAAVDAIGKEKIAGVIFNNEPRVPKLRKSKRVTSS